MGGLVRVRTGPSAWSSWTAFAKLDEGHDDEELSAKPHFISCQQKTAFLVLAQGVSDPQVLLIDCCLFLFPARVEREALAELAAKLRIFVRVEPRVISENLVRACSGMFSSDAPHKPQQRNA
jgi:hypothetical protein